VNIRKYFFKDTKFTFKIAICNSIVASLLPMQPLVPVPNGANIKGFVFLVDNSFGAEGSQRSGINSLPLEK
jgi:hypothetical protein